MVEMYDLIPCRKEFLHMACIPQAIPILFTILFPQVICAWYKCLYLV